MISTIYHNIKPLPFLKSIIKHNHIHRHQNTHLFLIHQKPIKIIHKNHFTLVLASSDDKPNTKDSFSSDLKEVSNMDQLIDLLLSCNSKEQANLCKFKINFKNLI